MEDNKNLKSLRELVEKELSAFVTKGSLTPTDVETAKNAVCLIKEIDEVINMPYDETSGGRMHRYSYGWYDPEIHDSHFGRSYGYRGDFRINEDPMMRSRVYGHSGHSIDDRIVDTLEKMMDSAQSNYERRKINDIIRVVDSMRGE